MGGDHGPPVTVPAAIDVLAKYPDLHLILVGDAAVLAASACNLQSYDQASLNYSACFTTC